MNIMRPELIQIISAGVAGIGFAMIFHLKTIGLKSFINPTVV